MSLTAVLSVHDNEDESVSREKQETAYKPWKCCSSAVSLLFEQESLNPSVLLKSVPVLVAKGEVLWTLENSGAAALTAEFSPIGRLHDHGLAFRLCFNWLFGESCPLLRPYPRFHPLLFMLRHHNNTTMRNNRK